MTDAVKEYAEALFAIALEKDALPSFAQNLETVAGEVEKEPMYLDFLASPALPLTERIKALTEAFSSIVCEEVISFLILLIKNGRIKDLIACIDEFFALKSAKENVSEALVYYAMPISDKQKQRLKEKLENMTSKKIEMIFLEDKSLLGGIKVVLDGKVLDGSVKHHLEDIKGVMSK